MVAIMLQQLDWLSHAVSIHYRRVVNTYGTEIRTVMSFNERNVTKLDSLLDAGRLEQSKMFTPISSRTHGPIMDGGLHEALLTNYFKPQ